MVLKSKSEGIKTFWITNISNKNVSLSDLNLTVPARTSVNLLDPYHYYYTEAQLLQSAKNGSIFKKSDKIKVRKIPPNTIQSPIIDADPNAVLPERTKSIYEIEQKKYEELTFDDDIMAPEKG